MCSELQDSMDKRSPPTTGVPIGSRISALNSSMHGMDNFSKLDALVF